MNAEGREATLGYDAEWRFMRRNHGSNLNGFAAVNRGGNWNDGTNAGLATANLNNGPGNRNSNIGFRAAAL